MTTLRVREFSWRDMDRIFQITMSTFPRDLEMIGFCKKTFDKKFRPLHIGKWVQKITKKEYAKVYVGETSEKVVAVATLRKMGPSWYVSGVMVDAEYQGKGYGRKIVVSTCESACSFGAERIILRVPEDKVVAKTLYKSLGFERFERVIQYVRDCKHVKEQTLPEKYKLVRINRFDQNALHIIDRCRSLQSAEIYGKSELVPWHNRVLQRVFQTEIIETYAITAGSTWVGVITFRTDQKRKGAGYVSIDVIPEHRGQGLEEALLTQNLTRASNLGLPQLIAWANQDTELTNVCEQLGFSQREVLEGMFKVCQ